MLSGNVIHCGFPNREQTVQAENSLARMRMGGMVQRQIQKRQVAVKYYREMNKHTNQIDLFFDILSVNR